MKTNTDLQARYETIYKRGEERHFSKFVAGQNVSEAEAAVLALGDWRGKSVLDIGCGTGSLVRKIRAAGATRVVGVDYSAEAIKIARDRTDDDEICYVCSDFFAFDSETPFDVVVTLGTIEHMDDPQAFLVRVERLMSPKGKMLITCPHFINIRGFVWMALALLQNVPMSLSDLHFVHPWQMREWAKAAGLAVESTRSVDHDRGNGAWLIRDFRKRLPNALRDAGIGTAGVESYLTHLQSLVDYMAEQAERYRLDGATALYVLSRDHGAVTAGK